MDGDAPGDSARSYSTLNTLYHESRREIDALHLQVSSRDGAVAELRARLGRYERVCLGVDGKEPVLVGPSGSLLESLCREVCSARRKGNESEMKAEKRQQEVQQLQVQLREKGRELESIRSQPDHAKDEEIQRLRLALEERGRVEATRAVLCSSLAEEAEQLRDQLGTTVKTCQELLARLEGEKGGGGGGGGGGREEILRMQKAKEQTETSNINGRLQDENKHLKQRVAYVEMLNSKWQKYDSSREEYVRSLCQRLRGSDAQITPTSSTGPGGGTGSAGSRVLRQEIARLNRLLEEKVEECTRLGRESQERRQDRERTQTLEQQVLIYEEDFKSERADRERAQGRIQDLKLEIRALQQQQQQQQQQHSKQASREREPREAAPACHAHTGHRTLPGRGADSQAAPPPLRTGPNPPECGAGPLPLGPAWSQHHSLSELQCPRCLTTFSDQDPAQYLNHCEECAEF